MSALVPYNYGGFSSQRHFGSHQRKNNNYPHYDQRFMRQQPFIPRSFPTQSYYQPHFYPTNGYGTTGYNQPARPAMAADLMSLNRSNQQYRYAQYIRHMNEMQNRNWKREANPGPLPRYTESFPEYYTTGPIYHYEKETRYVPYLVYVGQGAGRNIGHGYLPTSRYAGGLNTTLAPMSGTMNLPPKIRVIFIPPGSPSLQQPYTGALGMPPFFFNRMAQPLCALPLPPPLPQIASLPLTPSVQQMVMQRYANPVAVLPFMPNWQIPQPMIPYYPPISQPQQQLITPVSALQPSQPMIPYYPQISQPQQQLITPVSALLPPQPMIPYYPQISQPQQQLITPISALQPPQPMIPYYPQMSQPQQQLITSISALQPPQPIPQSYIPPTLQPTNMAMLLSNASSFPFGSVGIPSEAQYSNSGYSNTGYPNIGYPNTGYPHTGYPNTGYPNTGYPNTGCPSTCRACIPAPPPLNIAVTGHCWVQHCCACHHVPTDGTNPNTRPSDGRFTPLLRQPVVQQNTYNPLMYQQQQQQYPHINTSVTTRPWVHNMPPLPPGAVIISDEYVNNNDFTKAYHFSQNYAVTQPRVFTSIPRSITLPTMNTDKNRVNENRSRKNKHKKRKDPDNSQSNSKSNSITSFPPKGVSSTRRSSTSSSGSVRNALKADKESKSDIVSNNTEENLARQQSSAAAHNVNLRYNYQPPDLESVYNNNPYFKSSDTDSISFSNPSASPNSRSIKEDNHNSLSSPVYLNLIEEEGEKKSIHTPSPPLSQSERPVKRIIIIRQFTASSPSTISTMSSSLSLHIMDDNSDSMPTNTPKADQTNENTATLSETF